MSIIYEALKKAQKRLTLPLVVKKNKKPPHVRFYFAFVIFAAFGCAIALFMIVYTPKIKFPSTLQVSKLASQTAASPDLSSVIDSSDKIPGMSNLAVKLKGVALINNEYFALVNERILKAGDFINGVQVKKIYEKCVEFKLGNKDFTLSLK